MLLHLDTLFRLRPTRLVLAFSQECVWHESLNIKFMNSCSNARLRSLDWLVDWIVLNATFNSIPVISWRPVLLVEEAEYPERTTDFGKATGTLFHIHMLWVNCTLIFAIAQSQARARTTEVIGYNDLCR